VVTQDQIAAQGVQSVNDALRYTPGVSLESFGANTFFDFLKLRGFDAPRYLDGLRLPNDSTTFAVPRIETYGLDRLEVLKGPSSGLYGQSDPGGLINMVSKRPTATPHYSVEGTFGSFERFQGAFDIGGPVDKNGEFLYRLVGLGRDSNTQTDIKTDHKK
jgi:iron complex outermembrane receptor protein